MSREYSENVLVQNSAGNLLQNVLGWEVVLAYNSEKLGPDGTLGRTSYREVLLTRYFRQALLRLNPWLTPNQLDEVQKKFTAHVSTASLMQINEEKYFLLRDGIPVTVKRPDGRTEIRSAAVIDFKNPENNHFLAVKEMKIHSQLYRRRTDIVGFVNGIPLLFIELKKPTVDVQNAYIDNYRDYLDTVPQLFYYNAFLMLSNGLEAKVGTLGSKYEFFHEWKRLKESDAGSVELETMLRGICEKKTFLDLLENFILYDHSGGRTTKILARNHQYLGVNEAVSAYENRKLKDGRLGVFWHTQGSGKSYSMVFLAQKIRRKFAGSPTIVVLTDRDELNRQISDTFENCGLLGKTKASQFIASSGTDLVKKLQGNPSFVFTLIQKFNLPKEPPIYPDHDILILSDEAHRSQYGIFADNMMHLLPTASRIGFTGTPLLADDHITERTFGGYLSVYDFKRAVEDGATVPLYYENRADKIAQLDKPEITGRILDAIEAADLDPSQEEKLEREFAKEIHILTADERLRSIAKDFVEHYSDLWTSGKAMFVCLNKVTCVRMYNYVQECWQAKIRELEARQGTVTQQEAQELARKLAWMKETEMAVVISQEQNEVQTFKKWGLDILPHRAKMEKRELDKEFKDSKNPFRVVFVCAMWLTGFDVKCLSCLYLDKPLKAHTLMQTIARANRVSEGKSNGLIVDYIGIVKALRKALADYTVSKNSPAGVDPTVTCVRMYNYVQEYWRAKIRELEARQGTATQQEAQELARKLAWMKETEMAVVISPEQNEVQTFKKWGLDILPHRAKMEKRELDKEFKDSKNPFRVVFVCAMWLTGFDVKCLSCLYLDKPLKAHTLMQTIARANRVSEGKSNGLIVDYIGIVKALRKALADYTVSKNSPAGVDPTVDKTELIQRIRTVIGKTDGFLAEHGFRLQELVDAQDFEKMNLVQDAVNAMCETLETKKTFQTYASELARLFRYADRDDVDDAVRARKNAILAIYEGLQQKRKHADNTDLMVQINGIVNEYIHVEKPDQEAVPSRQFDISKIDFELLSREFAYTRRKNLLLRDLDELVNQQLAKMLFANPQRIDYYDRYQEIIDAYNAEQNRATIEKTFMDLMELASSLDMEQQRYVREGFSSDEELSVYDLLFSENLTKQEIETIKKVSVDLLTKIKQQIAKLDHWTDKQETKAIVDNLIRNTLWQELPNSYDVSDIQTYQKKIYEYVYMRYPEVA